MLVRLCLVIQVIHYSYHYVSQIPGCDKKELTHCFKTKVENVIKHLDSTIFIIQKDILLRALDAHDYFTKQKLIFFGFTIDPLATMSIISEKLLTEASAKIKKTTCTLRSTDNTLISHKVLNIMQIILTKEKCVLWPRLIHNGNAFFDETTQAMEHLVNFGFGTISEIPALNNQRVPHFFKIKYADLIHNPKLIKTIVDMGLDLAIIAQSMLKAEADPEASLTIRDKPSNKKRIITDVQTSPNALIQESKKKCSTDNDRTTIIGHTSAPANIPRRLINQINTQRNLNQAIIARREPTLYVSDTDEDDLNNSKNEPTDSPLVGSARDFGKSIDEEPTRDFENCDSNTDFMNNVPSVELENVHQALVTEIDSVTTTIRLQMKINLTKHSVLKICLMIQIWKIL